MRERTITNLRRDADAEPTVQLSSDGTTFTVEAVASEIIRVRLWDDTRPLATGTLPLSDLKPLAINATAAKNDTTQTSFQTDTLKVVIDWKDAPIVSVYDRKTSTLQYQDLPYRSYNTTAFGFKHYTRMDRTDLQIGLGEVGAPINLATRSFELSMSDSASYDAFNTDPLYKHTPFLVTLPVPHVDDENESARQCVGIFSASRADSRWNVGRYIDEPWNGYKTFEVDAGGLENYLIFGADIQQIVQKYMFLVGQPLMPPKWSLGYLASSMGLAESDNPPAQTLLEGFHEKCTQYRIPCSAMHLSSGYTFTQTKLGWSRNVFTMNKHRFPDFQGFCRSFHVKGMRIVPNLKPFLVEYHPDYAKLKENKALFVDPVDNKTVVTKIWAAGICETLDGGWLDTTSQAGFNWWYKGVSDLIELGVDGAWNDNDEYTLHEDDYKCAYELACLLKPLQSAKCTEDPLETRVGIVGRSLFTEMLGKASFEALRKYAADRRPFILTRSSSMGTKQYAVSTWSGDNKTNWKTLKGNVDTTINASLSLYHSYGSDVGGFAGPLPTPELFLRWVQVNAYHTRFSIHSFKPNANDPTGQATVNNPWMYPEITHLVRNAIQRRYELIPYMYNLLHEGRELATPPVTFMGFPPFHRDIYCYTQQVMECGNFWLGVGRVLVASILEPGQSMKSAYLPKIDANDKEVYFNTTAPYGIHEAGSTVELVTSLESIPVFVRSGSVIPIQKPCATISPGLSEKTNDGTVIEVRPGLVERDDFRGVEIYPPPIDSSPLYSYEWLEDDGESSLPCPCSAIRLEYQVKDDKVKVTAKWSRKEYQPFFKTLFILLPRSDERKIIGDLVTGNTQLHHDGRSLTEIGISE